jgi:hypothetical protein
MTPAASVSFFRSEFNEFLYAPIGSETNGMTLSVLSAFARLNVDPWEEAAQLSELPRETAAQRLATLIARLPSGPWAARGDYQTIADRLIELLPCRSSDVSSTGDIRAPSRINLSAVPIMIAVALGLAALFIAAGLSRTDHEEAPAYSAASPPQRR